MIVIGDLRVFSFSFVIWIKFGFFIRRIRVRLDRIVLRGVWGGVGM